MLQNLNKCNAYVLIDIEYLNDKIEKLYNYYNDLYPQKQFKDFELKEFLKIISTTCRIDNLISKTNVILFHKLGAKIAHSNGQISVSSYGTYPNQRTMTNSNGYTMNLYSFFANPEPTDAEMFSPMSSYDEEFLSYIREISSMQGVSNILICKDSNNIDTIDIYNYYLDKIDRTTEINKNFFLIKNLDSEMGPSNSQRFFSVVLDYIIAMCIGLKEYEW